MEIVKLENIQELILDIGDEKVLLDSDVADIYGVKTKNKLVENFDRFNKLKHSSTLPKAFSEKGFYLLATILTTKQAV